MQVPCPEGVPNGFSLTFETRVITPPEEHFAQNEKYLRQGSGSALKIPDSERRVRARVLQKRPLVTRLLSRG